MTAALPRERGGWILSSISLSRWGLPGGTRWHGVETPSRYHRPFLALERQGVSSAAGSEAFPACGDALAVVVAGRTVVAAGRLYELPVAALLPGNAGVLAGSIFPPPTQPAGRRRSQGKIGTLERSALSAAAPGCALKYTGLRRTVVGGATSRSNDS